MYFISVTPLTPVVLQVVCKSNHAIIIWTSRHPEYDDVEHQETLQLSKKDNTFNNATYEKLNDTHAGIHLYKVNVLKPNTKYIFRVLASNRHGTAFSNNPSCITDLEQVEGIYCSPIFVNVLHFIIEILYIRFPLCNYLPMILCTNPIYL